MSFVNSLTTILIIFLLFKFISIILLAKFPFLYNKILFYHTYVELICSIIIVFFINVVILIFQTDIFLRIWTE